MSRRLTAILAVLAFAAAALAAGGVFGGGDDDPAPTVAAASGPRDPHPKVRSNDPEMRRVLQAAEAASTARPAAALAAEGRRLFRSTEMAKAGESCQSCHVEGGGTNAALGTILHPQAQGDFKGPRDVPSLWGIADTAPYGWDGHEPSLEAFAVGTIRNHFKTGETQPLATTGKQAAALVAYLRTLAPPVSAFDQGTLSAAAQRGEELFQGKGGCMECHGGPFLTDTLQHATLVPKVAATDTDPGAVRAGIPANSFDTPHLRDLRNTAPYMHNGRFATLREVVEFYDRDSSLAPLRLTPSEIDDLVAYLESL
ncbi:MAG TPA: c-type cytochrome [Miltoncostaeaceae bacterium]|nr:c-type cytochrome [Miltoncostaeaceae bacterium]